MTIVWLVVLVLCLAEEWRSHGQSLVGWALALLAIVALLGLA